LREVKLTLARGLIMRGEWGGTSSDLAAANDLLEGISSELDPSRTPLRTLLDLSWLFEAAGNPLMALRHKRLVLESARHIAPVWLPREDRESRLKEFVRVSESAINLAPRTSLSWLGAADLERVERAAPGKWLPEAVQRGPQIGCGWT